MWKPKFYRASLPYNRHHWISLILLLLIVFEGITGGLLAFYYRPSTEQAFESTNLIRHEVFIGDIIYSIHYWGARFLLIFVILHGLQIALQRDYLRYPFQWVIGVTSLLVLFGEDLTGRLLPWTQSAYWTAVRAMESLSFIPLIGPVFIYLIGGKEVTGATLTRFYFSHVSLFVAALVALILYHTYLAIRDGLRRPGPPRPVHPDFVYFSLNIGLLTFGMLASVGVLLPPAQEEVADPLTTPTKVTSPWYLFPILGIERWISPMLSGTLFLAMWIYFFLLPWLDKGKRGVLRWGLPFFVFLMILLIIFGSGS